MKKNENRQIIVTFHKAQVQVDQELNIKPDTLYLMEEKVGKSPELIGTGKFPEQNSNGSDFKNKN